MWPFGDDEDAWGWGSPVVVTFTPDGALGADPLLWFLSVHRFD